MAKDCKWDISDYIPIGYEKRVSRAYLAAVTRLKDRDVRRLIEKSDALIVSADGGYFIPDFSNQADSQHCLAYMVSEKNRIETLSEKYRRNYEKILASKK